MIGPFKPTRDFPSLCFRNARGQRYFPNAPQNPALISTATFRHSISSLPRGLHRSPSLYINPPKRTDSFHSFQCFGSLSSSRIMISIPARSLLVSSVADSASSQNLGFTSFAVAESNVVGFDRKIKALGICIGVRSRFLAPVKAMEESRMAAFVNGKVEENAGQSVSSGAAGKNDCDCAAVVSGTNGVMMANMGKSTNIVWQECSIGKLDREKLLGQKGCVLWITGLSGSGKSTVACALSQALHRRGKLTYILDGDNVRHGLNQDLSFKTEDRAENIRRVGEVAKLFADAGVICIASLISPYRRDRDACRALLAGGDFIEVFMNVPLDVCEKRDAKGLYKLARAGKIKGFTGIDDPYEPPLNCEIEIQLEKGFHSSPSEIAEKIISYLEEKGFLYA